MELNKYLGAPKKAPFRSLGFLLGWYEAGWRLMELGNYL